MAKSKSYREEGEVEVVKSLSKTIATDIYQLVKSGAKSLAGRWKLNRTIERLPERIDQICRVKTLLHLEHPVDLRDIYYPPRFRKRSRDQGNEGLDFSTWRAESNDSPEFGSFAEAPPGPITIVGTAGQGKSTFLRWLAANTITTSNCLPLFIQLRDSDQHGVFDLICKEAKDLRIELNEDLFNFLADSGRLVLLMDGFDEVPGSVRGEVLEGLESIANQHPNARLVTSTRPGSELVNSWCFSSLEMRPLEPRDHFSAIHAIEQQKSAADTLCAKLKTEAGGIRPLLTTPLMMTLMIVRFRVTHDVPASEVAFFRDILEVLLSRHDRVSKPGYARERKSGASDQQFRELFEMLAFRCREADRLRFESRGHAVRFTRDCLNYCKLPELNAEEVLSDLIRVTSLLVEDGAEIHWIHKLVPEFYSASFIANMKTDDFVQRFYDRVKSRGWRPWQEELEFLALIDDYRLARFYYIDLLESVLPCGEEALSADHVVRALGDSVVSIDMDAEPAVRLENGDLLWPGVIYVEPSVPVFRLGRLACYSKIQALEIAASPALGEIANSTNRASTVYEILRLKRAHPQHADELTPHFEPLVGVLQSVLENARQLVAEKDDLGSLLLPDLP